MYIFQRDEVWKFLSGWNHCRGDPEKGVHYVEVALNEIRCLSGKGKCIPICRSSGMWQLWIQNMQLDMKVEYTLYEDGVHKDYDREENYRVLKK